jgi:septal ring-binding cell division protein DamX
MASRGNRSGAGERVLESKHVIGLFMLMLVFSGVFFALGYVMGRNQYDGQVRAASNPRAAADPVAAYKPDVAPKRAKESAPAADPSSDVNSQPSSDWGFYNAAKTAPEDRLKPAVTSTSAAPVPTPAVANSKSSAKTANVSSKSASAQQLAGYTLQVAALRRESDAHAVAVTLQKKKFPAFVAAPQSDKYYHVQVGPYPDQKSAEAAKKGLETAGFKAIVKH